MSRSSCSRILMVLAALVWAGTSYAQTTWYVDDNAPGDPGPGDPTVGDPDEDGSADHPFDAIQEGINAAVNDDTVLVLDGTYTGDGNKNLDFGGRLITVRSENGPDSCIIDCEGNGRGFHFHSGETVAAVVAGFTIRDGYVHADNGGGIYCYQSSPTITRCVIRDNTVFGWYTGGTGGGVYCSESSPTITGCVIRGNSVTSDYTPALGGGIACTDVSNPIITDCVISENSTEYLGGGIDRVYSSSPTITNCTISGNTAIGGGGIDCNRDSSPTLTYCTISGNSAGSGGGVLCTVRSQPTLTNCTISGNWASSGGGARCTSNLTLTNCRINGNSANNGGGVHCKTSDSTLTNCTISGNSALYGGGVFCGYYGVLTLTNCILWADEPEEIYVESSGDPVVTYCDVQGGWPGYRNIDADPLFTSTEDFHLMPASPCLDAGRNSAVPTDTLDLDGDGDSLEPLPFDLDRCLRFVDGAGDAVKVVDMGVYERQCLGDLDGDRDIDLDDLTILLTNYQAPGTVYSDGDLDQDEDVDLSDLAALLSVYGTTCE